MQELEKILEEINEIEDEYTNEDHDIMFKLGAAGIAVDIKDIIRKHMNEKVTTNDLISRQALLDDFRNTITENSDTFDWLNMIARQHTVNKGDSWITVDDRMPEKNEYFVETSSDKDFPNGYYKRLEIAYMTDTIEYVHGYYDGYKWMDKYLNAIKNVVAWRIHEPYLPERSDNHD